jgi:Mg-chelatase subunit ChlI
VTNQFSERLVEELVEAVLEVTLSARSRRGIVADEIESLRRLLVACRDDWAHSNVVPRAAVNVLVDLQPSLVASADLYEEAIRCEILDLAIELGDLVRDAVEV